MRALNIFFWSVGILLWVGCGDDESSVGNSTGGAKTNTGGSVAQGGGKGGQAAATGGMATGGTPGATGGLGSSGVPNEAGSGGVSEASGGGVSGFGDDGVGGNGGVSGASNGGVPTESACLATAGADACEARGCNPVTGTIWRAGGGAGEGGTGGGNGSCTPGEEIFVGCSLGSGGDVYACGCKVNDPTTCLYADSMLRFVTDEWVNHANCRTCGP